jgi:cytochrome b involved in lipid metabolism
MLSWDEVRKHNTITDAWLVIDGFVYDVGPFLAFHPGGQRVLKPHLGKDGSRAFHKIGHSEAAKIIMSNFRIGRLAADGGSHG